MATKHSVLEILEKNRDICVSGEFIAEQLNVSRNMVWRAVNDLRDKGYIIEAVTNKGYRLTGENDILSVAGIAPYLKSSDITKNITVHQQIDSTNKEAKVHAVNGAAHGTVIIAESQTSGRGRYGRDFFSPPGSGLYMSFVLFSNIMKFAEPTAITAYAALCVCEVLESVCNIKTSIKWVNDIFLDGKKICGILTEAVTVFENRSVGEIVLGIGINVCTKPQDFPEPLSSSAGSLYPEGKTGVSRNRLAAEIINRILFSDIPNEKELFENYKKRLFMLGTDITVVQGNKTYAARALDVNEQGHLIIQDELGEIRALSSGEISIK